MAGHWEVTRQVRCLFARPLSEAGLEEGTPQNARDLTETCFFTIVTGEAGVEAMLVSVLLWNLMLGRP